MDNFIYNFLLPPCIALILCIIPSAVLGSYIVTTNISYIVGGISHAVVGGIGICLILNDYVLPSHINPIWCTILSTIMLAKLISYAKHHLQQHEDAIISVMWSVGSTIGLFCLTLSKFPSTDLISIMTGNIFWISNKELLCFFIFNISLIMFIYNHWMQIYVMCFNINIAKMRKIDTYKLYTRLICFICIFIVMLVYTMGTLLALTILTLPSLAAMSYKQTLCPSMLISALLSSISLLGGFSIAIVYNLNASASISLVAIIIYIISLIYNNRRELRINK